MTKLSFLGSVLLTVVLMSPVAWAQGPEDLAASSQMEIEMFHPGYPGYPAYPPTSGYSYNYCQAQTMCPNGMPIRCWTYGNPYTHTACGWYVAPGAYVECRGFNDFGAWVVAWARCF